ALLRAGNSRRGRTTRDTIPRSAVSRTGWTATTIRDTATSAVSFKFNSDGGASDDTQEHSAYDTAVKGRSLAVGGRRHDARRFAVLHGPHGHQQQQPGSGARTEHTGRRGGSHRRHVP